MNTFYLVWEVTTALTSPQRQAIVEALRTFGLQSDGQPYRITHWRPRLDGQAVLLVLTVVGTPAKADFLAALAAALGISQATLNANSVFTLMAGSDVDARAQSARDFVIANSAVWEPVP